MSGYLGEVLARNPVGCWRLGELGYRAEVRRLRPAGYWRMGAEPYVARVKSLGPDGYWRLGETSGPTAVDAMGLHNGTYYGAPAIGATGLLPGDPNKAMGNVVAGSGVDLGTITIGSSTRLTVMGWMAVPTMASDGYIHFAIRNWAGGDGTWLLTLWKHGATYTLQAGIFAAAAQHNVYADTSPGTHFVVFTYDGRTLRLYSDGVEVASLLDPGLPVVTNAPFGIGQNTGSEAAVLDEVAHFSRALTAAEIATLYASASLDVATAYDEMGVTNGAYIANPTLGAPGALADDRDTAVTLNGSSQYAQVPDAAPLDLGDTFSIALWLKIASTPGEVILVGKGVGAYTLKLAGNKPQLTRYGVDNGKIASVTVVDGQWHFVVATRSPGVEHIYVDGVDVTSGSLSGGAFGNTATTLQIGAYGGSNFVGGTLDEIAVFPTVLSPADVARLYALGTVATARDSSGNGHDGVYQGKPLLAQRAGILSERDASVGFNGAGHYVTVADHPALRMTTKLSVACWVRPQPNGEADGRIVAHRAGQLGYEIYVLTDAPDEGKIGLFLGGATAELSLGSGNARVFDGRWHLIVGTYDGANAILYIDGVPIVRNAAALGSISTPASLVMGKYGEYDIRYLKGGLDEVAVFDTALSGDDVRTLWEAGIVGSAWRESQLLRAPAHFWRFEEPVGAIAYDEMGADGDATIVGATLGQPGLTSGPGKAALFDGVDDYVQLPNRDFSGNSGGTLSAWVRPDSFPGINEIVCYEGAGGAWKLQYGNAVDVPGQQKLTAVVGSTLIYDPTVSVAGRTYHVAVTTDWSTYVRLYKDGVRVASAVFSGANPGASSGRIGAHPNTAGREFHGVIDEASVFASDVGDDGVASMYAWGSSPYLGQMDRLHPDGYWRLGFGDGVVANEFSGHGLVGTYGGTVEPGVHGALSGEPDPAARWPVAYGSARVDFPSIPPVPPKSQSISAWARSVNTTEAIDLFGARAQNSNILFDLIQVNGEMAYYIANPGDGGASAASGLADGDGKWHFWVGTYDGAVMRLYRDAVLVRTVVYSGTPTSVGAVFRIGMDAYGRAWQGDIDEVALFPIALNALQVHDLFLAGRSRWDSKVLSLGPKAWWRLGELSGTVAREEIAASDGTYVGSPTRGAAGLIAGDDNAAVGFDGVAQGMVAPGPFAGVSNWSMAAWFMPTVLPQRGSFIASGDDSDGPAGISIGVGSINAASSGLQVLYAGVAYIDGGYTFPDTTSKHLIVVTRDASTTRVYVDGVQTATGGATPLASVGHCAVGAALQGGVIQRPIAGIVDEAMIFDRELSPTEVAALYAAGAALIAEPTFGGVTASGPAPAAQDRAPAPAGLVTLSGPAPGLANRAAAAPGMITLSAPVPRINPGAHRNARATVVVRAKHRGEVTV